MNGEYIFLLKVKSIYILLKKKIYSVAVNNLVPSVELGDPMYSKNELTLAKTNFTIIPIALLSDS